LMRALIESTGGPAHVIGHSYGGVIAMNLARRYPYLFISMTLIEPVAFNLLRKHPGDEDLLQLNTIKDNCAAAMAEGDYSSAARMFVSYWSGRKTWEDLSVAIRKFLAKGMTKVVSSWEEISADPSEIDTFSGIQTPTLVVSGNKSPSPIQWVTKQLAATLQQATLLQIEGASHMSPITHGSRIASAIFRHLKKSSAFASILLDESDNLWPSEESKITREGTEASQKDDLSSDESDIAKNK